MPIVARELGGLDLYGWVFSAFFLAHSSVSSSSAVLIDRRRPHPAVRRRPRPVRDRPPHRRPRPDHADPHRRSLPPGLRCRSDRPGRLRGHRPEPARAAAARMFATLSTAWVLPGRHRAGHRRARRRAVDWRAVFLGLIPLIVLSGALDVSALRRVPPPIRPTPPPSTRSRRMPGGGCRGRSSSPSARPSSWPACRTRSRSWPSPSSPSVSPSACRRSGRSSRPARCGPARRPALGGPAARPAPPSPSSRSTPTSRCSSSRLAGDDSGRGRA